MQIILEANGLWEMIEPNEKTQADNKKDKTAIAFIYQALPEEQLLQITKHKTAKAIWDALKTRHIGEERVQQARLQTLKSDFEMLHMKEDEAIDTFTAKLTTLVNKAASLGHTIEDSIVVRKLLNAVPDKFLQIVASIEQYSDLDEMSVEEAIGRLKTFEERIKVKKGKAFEDQDKLLFTKHNDNGQRHRYDNQGRGRYIPPHSRNRDDNRQHGKEDSLSQDYNEAMEKPRDFSKVKCYNCNEYGHYASHCRKRDQRQQRQEASNLVEEDLEPTLLMASTSFNKTQKKSSKDTPTNKSIWFAKDYDHEDSKFGEIILEEDKEGHDQDYDKLNKSKVASALGINKLAVDSYSKVVRSGDFIRTRTKSEDHSTIPLEEGVAHDDSTDRDEDFECGEETYYPALNVGTDKSCTI
ncbi:zinc finger, CCHC-type containing protein, partial [Tanacetum coccineum]